MDQRLQQNYQWLLQIPDLPRMVSEALKLFGTKEFHGKKHNPVILGWAKELGIEKIYTNDELAWCGLSIALVIKRAGKELPLKSYDILRALRYVAFGEHVPEGEEKLGDVLIFKRDGGGHVGLYIGEDSAAFHVLSGNQGDEFNIARLGKQRLYACRRPHYNNMPKSVRKYYIEPSGKISLNEA